MFIVRSFSHPVLIQGAVAPVAVRARGTAMGGKQAGSPKQGWIDKPFGVMCVQGTLPKWTRPNLPNPNTCREMSGNVFWSWVVLYKMEGYTKTCQLKRGGGCARGVPTGNVENYMTLHTGAPIWAHAGDLSGRIYWNIVHLGGHWRHLSVTEGQVGSWCCDASLLRARERAQPFKRTFALPEIGSTTWEAPLDICTCCRFEISMLHEFATVPSKTMCRIQRIYCRSRLPSRSFWRNFRRHGRGR